ncbi:helix-turn-helix transcriptional regulator [Streptomyces filamentosus]|uniref:helix-turn-helix transcriptional regulator n=1 Tax=Streptomyces filamentosus TaxID=67294 RepID=UPI0037D948A5
MSMSRPLLTQREAAAACGVSRSTIRRRREAGELPGCVQDEERGWLIPVDALLAAGFRLNAPTPPENASAPAAEGGAAAAPAPAEAGGDVAGLRAELERERERQALVREADQARHEAALAAAEVAHLREQLALKGAQLAAKDGHIEDLRSALRALSPAPERTALGETGHQAAGGGVVVPGQVHPEPPSAPAGAAAAGTAAGDDGPRRRWWGGRR